MKSAIVNLGCIVSGDWRKPRVDGDAILIDGDKLVKVGAVTDADLKDCDLVVDANGVTACPGLHRLARPHRLRRLHAAAEAVGFLQSYLHGGTTTAISALRSARAGHAARRGGRQGARGRRQALLGQLRPGGMRVTAATSSSSPA